MPDDLVFSVHPGRVAALFHRCIRCMYDYVHEGADARTWPSFFQTGSHALAGARRADGTIDVAGVPVRLRSEADHVESEPIVAEDAGVRFVIVGDTDGILETPDGTTLVTYQRDADTISPPLYRWELAGYAFAAEHPADQQTPSVEIDRIAILEFATTATPRKGRIETGHRPARLIPLDRDHERFLMFLRVVARILAGNRPRPADDCPQCARSRQRVPA